MAENVPEYLMLLTTFALLLNLLLLLQFFCDTSLTQGLSLAAFVCFAIECCLQGCITPHTHYNILPQL